MILFYSGSIAPNTTSTMKQSLGGYISNSQIPNSLSNSLFSTISKESIRSNKREVKLIVLQNISGATITDLKVYTIVTSTLFTLKIDTITPVYDSTCSKYYFESIQTPEQLPYQSTPALHEGLVNAITISSLANNGYIGIWVSREYTAEALALVPAGGNSNLQTSDNCTTESIDKLKAQLATPITEEEFTLHLEW